MKKQKKPEHSNLKGLKILTIISASVFVLMTTVFCVTYFTGFLITPTTYYLINILVSFSSFVATLVFGVSIFYHNASIREQNAAIRNQTTAVNRRAEAFRNLQFIASNYTIIDFVDNMQIYEESARYTKKLRESQNFQFYVFEKGILKEEVLENFDDFRFLTVKIPIAFVEGKKTIGKLRFLSLKFDKGDSVHRFSAPTEDGEPTALILYNEVDHRNEAVVNLIMRKTSDFYQVDEVNQFLKIKIILEVESMLGVIVNGAIELYFTNPEKLEKSGANKYKINSSQFELLGKPKLNIGKQFDLD